MKKLIPILLLLCQSSWGAFALVHKTTVNGAASPQVVTLSAGSTAGNLLVCGIALVDQTKVVSSVVSNAGSGLTTFGQATNAKATNTAQTLLTDIWYLYNAGAATTVTVTATASMGSVECYEYSGGGTANSFDAGSAANDLAVAATLTGPSMTTGTTGEMIFVKVADSNSAISANSPYNTDFGADGTSGHAVSDHIPAGTVSGEAVVFNDSSTGGGCISAAKFCPSGGCTAASNAVSQCVPGSHIGSCL